MFLFAFGPHLGASGPKLGGGSGEKMSCKAGSAFSRLGTPTTQFARGPTSKRGEECGQFRRARRKNLRFRSKLADLEPEMADTVTSGPKSTESDNVPNNLAKFERRLSRNSAKFANFARIWPMSRKDWSSSHKIGRILARHCDHHPHQPIAFVPHVAPLIREARHYANKTTPQTCGRSATRSTPPQAWAPRHESEFQRALDVWHSHTTALPHRQVASSQRHVLVDNLPTPHVSRDEFRSTHFRGVPAPDSKSNRLAGNLPLASAAEFGPPSAIGRTSPTSEPNSEPGALQLPDMSDTELGALRCYATPPTT